METYSQHDAEAIVARVEDCGELASAVAAGLLAPEDEGPATEAYVGAMEPVPFDHPSWGPVEAPGVEPAWADFPIGRPTPLMPDRFDVEAIARIQQILSS